MAGTVDGAKRAEAFMYIRKGVEMLGWQWAVDEGDLKQAGPLSGLILGTREFIQRTSSEPLKEAAL
jgi:hypothetical protein